MRFMICAFGADQHRVAYARSAAEAIDVARRWSLDGLTVEISDRSGKACPVERFIEWHRNQNGDEIA